jgi:large subunit ribosomal protein L36
MRHSWPNWISSWSVSERLDRPHLTTRHLLSRAGNVAGYLRVVVCDRRRAMLWPSNGRSAEMKVRSSIRSLKTRPGSVVVRRHGRVRVINRRDPRWTARQG